MPCCYRIMKWKNLSHSSGAWQLKVPHGISLSPALCTLQRIMMNNLYIYICICIYIYMHISRSMYSILSSPNLPTTVLMNTFPLPTTCRFLSDYIAQLFLRMCPSSVPDLCANSLAGKGASDCHWRSARINQIIDILSKAYVNTCM